MNILPSVSPAYPVVSGAATATTSSVAPSGAGATAGEGFAPDQEPEAPARPQGLDQAQLKELTELKARDQEVRAHEAAHQAVGGQYAGAMSFTYQRGPDGAQYAVGGEVPIDVSRVAGDPQATIEKMRVVGAAAMAPAQPSAQDRAVAAQAMQTLLQAQSEMAVGDRDQQTDPASSTDTDQQGQTANGRQANEAYRSILAMQEGVADAVTSVFA
ncbi:MAG: putative metalloprotease CJM1_0395 family protein [Marinobacter sp.]